MKDIALKYKGMTDDTSLILLDILTYTSSNITTGQNQPQVIALYSLPVQIRCLFL